MQTGEYIVDRLLPDVVRQISKELGFGCRSYSDDWILEIIGPASIRRIIGYKFDLNSSAAASIASDKVATYQLLTAHTIPAIPHYLVRTKASAHTIPHHLTGRDVVIKPLTGTSGHGVQLYNNKNDIERYIAQSGIEAWAVSPYVAVKQEVRLILLDEAPLLAYEKIPKGTPEGLTMFNLGKGARPQAYEPDQSIIEQGAAALRALGLQLAAIDYVVLENGERHILEVNDGIMIEHYGRTSSIHMQQAYDAYRHIIQTMMR